jgi:hypothetical protein
MLFGESHLSLSLLASAIHGYKHGFVDLIHVMDKNVNRDCFKQQDRFYGILGILGYKDFIVDYNVNMDDLNKFIVKYAYSKGDISWMAVGGSLKNSFIQPIYNMFMGVGSIWMDDNSGIKFRNNTLSMKTATLGVVTRCEKFTHTENDHTRFCGWCVSIFRRWGFSNEEITDMFLETSDEKPAIVEIMKAFLDTASKGLNDDDQADEFSKQLDGRYTPEDIRKVLDMKNRVGIIRRDATIIEVKLERMEECVPFIVSGNANVGDKAKLVKIYDMDSKCLGIICDGDVRKGVFICTAINLPEDLYESHEFLL